MGASPPHPSSPPKPLAYLPSLPWSAHSPTGTPPSDAAPGAYIDSIAGSTSLPPNTQTHSFDYNTKSELVYATMNTNTYTYNYDQIDNRVRAVLIQRGANNQRPPPFGINSK